MAVNANNIRTGKYEIFYSCDGGATQVSAGYIQDPSLSFESELNELETHQGTVVSTSDSTDFSVSSNLVSTFIIFSSFLMSSVVSLISSSTDLVSTM